MDWTIPILLLIISYLIGSMPMGLITGKIVKNVDIRDYGSGNTGTTNTMRVLGRPWGVFVFFLDALKGGFIILLFRIGLFDAASFPAVFHPLLFGIVAAIGHIFPLFLRFKGGKAVATGVGIFLVYAPLVALIGLFFYFLALKLTRYVSVGSCTGAIMVLITTFVIYFTGTTSENVWVYLFGPGNDLWMPMITLVGNILIFYRHRGNFIRIKNGNEPKSNFMQKDKIDQPLNKRS